MATVYLITCTKTKDEAPGLHRADELYTSAYFKKMRRLAELQADCWFILSDKYGLLCPQQMISCYEVDLKKLPQYQRREWSQKTLEQILTETSPTDTIVMLAGSIYLEFLGRELQRRGYSVKEPMKGLRIGERLQWLDKEIADVGR